MICKKLTLSALPVAILAFCSSPALSADTLLTTQTTMIRMCGNLFEIDSNAAGLTAQQRALIVQQNLDNALIASKDRSSSAVRVEIVHRNPVVSLDHFLVATADGNSASRSNMSQMQLAETWAQSLRICLSDSSAVDKYISMLTGKYPEKKIALGSMSHDEIAVAQSEMLFPIELITPISTETTRIGDRMEAVISHDVPLQTTFASYLPAGTLVFGAVESALPYVPNAYAGKDAFTVNFYEFRTPDGQRIPIDAHIYGSINSPRQISIKPLNTECCGNGTTLNNLSYVTVHVLPSKGNIVGSWKGEMVDGPLGDTRSQEQLRGLGFDGHLRAQGLEYGMPRLTLNRHLGLLEIPAGQPMLLQLSATTTIAVAGRSL